MKVLIVDDEKHVREAIKLLGEWERHGITDILEAADGKLATEMIEEHAPQIVMTDMRMPRMDGTQLMEWLSGSHSGIKTIVISGYDDFDLVRHAIRHGGMDYILKPVDPAALNEALAKAVAACREEELKRRQSSRQSIEMNRMRPHYADKLLSDLIGGHGRREEILQQLREEYGLPEQIDRCAAAVISTAQLDDELLEKFARMKQLLYFTLTNIGNELLSAKRKGFAFHHLANPEEIVLLLWDDSMPMSSLLEDIHRGIDATLHRSVHIGAGSFQPFPEGLASSYQEAHRALWQRSLQDPAAWLHTLSAAGPAAPRPLRLSAHEEQFRLAALSGSREQISAAVDGWMQAVRQLDRVTPEQLVQWNAEWDWMLKQWMDQGAEAAAPSPDKDALLELPRSLPLDKHGRLSYDLWTSQYEGRLTAASRILTQKHSRENHIIHDIAAYLESHYAEDISLQEMAARFFLSREYISRRFKQEFHVNLSDFLARIRIEKAKLLLHNPQLRISQIAEMVGYQDEKYFSKVFKKQEGRTPNEFRKDLAAQTH
ncbi:two-component system response regulator YesN [Paenibacillus favisporus]|uniref:Two-component system response regulator YesN n=1 Tax=Paenibacillus favisporus TaxID=221028 RepID=A0ABV2F700_9BACL